MTRQIWYNGTNLRKLLLSGKEDLGIETKGLAWQEFTVRSPLCAGGLSALFSVFISCASGVYAANCIGFSTVRLSFMINSGGGSHENTVPRMQQGCGRRQADGSPVRPG